MIYFDCAASAPVLPVAREAFLSVSEGNPNASHAAGREARKTLENARSVIAECIGAEPEQIGFTSSATEACAVGCAVTGVYAASPHEHDAVRKCLPDTFVYNKGVAQILVSNETGQIFDEEVRNLVKAHKVFTDATAAMGHIGIDVKDLGVDALAAGGHKFGAFPGIGFVYVKDGIRDDVSFAGTPPVALAQAMAAALKYRTDNLGMAEELFHRRSVFAYILQAKLLGIVHINTPFFSIPTVLSVRFDGVNARELLTLMDVNGLCASAGSACHSDSDTPSRVLIASGLTPEQALSTVRFSFCEETSAEEFMQAADIVCACVMRLLDLSGQTHA